MASSPHHPGRGTPGDLPDPLPIVRCPPREGDSGIVIRPPGSKSLTNRALLLAALSSGVSRLRNALVDADDAQRMIEALRILGAEITLDGADTRVKGVGGRWPAPPSGVSLYLQNAGTATRFLAAAAALSAGPVTIDGNARMRERPIGELAATLPSLGVQVEFLGREGFPPIRLTPHRDRLAQNLTIQFAATRSSQFISALLMLGPWLPQGITIQLHGDITSPPYIQMTLRLLDRLGARVRESDDLRILRVGPAAAETNPEAVGLAAFDLPIEPDASGATYFWAAGAILPDRRVTVPGLGAGSLQGDAEFPALLARMGAERLIDAAGAVAVFRPRSVPLAPIEADMSDMPDAAMTLAAVCCFASGRSTLRGLHTLRVKETDRIAAMQTELRKVGVRVETDIPGDPNALSITPPSGGIDCSLGAPPVDFDTYDDHRMAMSLALIGLRRANCFIRDPGCVRKTYPGFWRDFARLRG